MKFVQASKHGLWQKITDSGQLDEAAAAEVEQAIGEFQQHFSGKQEKTVVA